MGFLAFGKERDLPEEIGAGPDAHRAPILSAAQTADPVHGQSMSGARSNHP